MKRAELIDKKLRYDGDVWAIAGVGTERDSQTYLHLVSTTRFRQQRNGPYPIQACCFVDDEHIQANLEG